MAIKIGLVVSVVIYNEVIANKLKGLLTSAIAAPLGLQFGFSNSLISLKIGSGEWER
ncbi:hypothetical protein [Nostoc sp.]|uniref:hypothetical protein n=1 Tax=Nostoc sp. TaxID=1180 RepID=UPI002FF81D66